MLKGREKVDTVESFECTDGDYDTEQSRHSERVFVRLGEAERERGRQWEGYDLRELEEESTHAAMMGGTHACCLRTHGGTADF